MVKTTREEQDGRLSLASSASRNVRSRLDNGGGDVGGSEGDERCTSAIDADADAVEQAPPLASSNSKTVGARLDNGASATAGENCSDLVAAAAACGGGNDDDDDESDFDYDAQDDTFAFPKEHSDAKAWMQGYFDRKNALVAKARSHRYEYNDSETFDLALELYNRQRAVPGNRPNILVANEFFERKPVRASHKNPCSECDIHFYFGMDYVQECAFGPFGGAKKLCTGCMGRRLKRAVGTNKKEILEALTPLRDTQVNGINVGDFAQRYLRH